MPPKKKAQPPAGQPTLDRFFTLSKKRSTTENPPSTTEEPAKKVARGDSKVAPLQIPSTVPQPSKPLKTAPVTVVLESRETSKAPPVATTSTTTAGGGASASATVPPTPLPRAGSFQDKTGPPFVSAVHNWPEPIPLRKDGGGKKKDATGPAPVTGAPTGSSKTPICKYFLSRGGCKQGKKCPYRHENNFGYGVVRVPWSELYTFVSATTKRSQGMWRRQMSILNEKITSSIELEEAFIGLLPPNHKGYPANFTGLGHVLDYGITGDENTHFFEKVLPWMQKLCLEAPKLFPLDKNGRGIPLLPQGQQGKVVLTQPQATTLLAMGFFGLFPFRHNLGRGGPQVESEAKKLDLKENQDYLKWMPFFNFGHLYSMHEPAPHAKMRCILQYFITIYNNWSTVTKESRIIEFVRTSTSIQSDHFMGSKKPLTDVVMKDDGVIEEAKGKLQADFANKSLGGGVLGRGCVQEEIRFVISPELLLSRLVCEPLLPHEAVIMNGAQQFSSYSGYAKTFAFTGGLPFEQQKEPGKQFQTLDIAVVAIDAVNFCQVNLDVQYQFLANWIARETVKAYAGFHGDKELSSLASGWSGTIATGNWGCGAFGGDHELKLLIQWVAASQCGRPLEYYTFGMKDLSDKFKEVQKAVLKAGLQVGDLYNTLLTYNSEREYKKRKGAPMSALPGGGDEDTTILDLGDETVDYDATLAVEEESPGGGLLERQQTGIRSVFEHLLNDIA